MASLDTTYLGLRLRSPIVASAGPLTGDLDTAARLADAGVGALVMPSLFEEEIVHEQVALTSVLQAGAEHFPEAIDYFPALPSFPSTSDRYLANLERIKARVPIPVIASLNASSPGGWVRYARMLGDAGADALELNVYRVAADPLRTAAQVEDEDVALVADVRTAVDIPLAVKLSPFYSALANFAVRVVQSGADGVVLFNRFYQPDLDVDTLEVVPRLDLSTPSELRLPLRWIAILRPLLHGMASLAATSGVETGADVAKALLVGADVAMTTSAVLRHGPEHVRGVEDQLLAWMDDHDYASVDQLRGSMSYATTDDPASFERANYVRVLHSWASSR
jgi:dihydroorotate dehydrogenase (fumarate)